MIKAKRKIMQKKMIKTKSFKKLKILTSRKNVKIYDYKICIDK